MWIIFKVIAALIGFVARFYAKHFMHRLNGGSERVVDGINVKVVTLRNKNDVIGTRFYFEFPCRAIFKLTVESKWDRFFKGLGISTELQTGDEEFDKWLYIASDNPAFNEELKNDPKSRDLIKQAFRSNCKYVACDGKTLTIQYNGDRFLDKETIRHCVNLRNQLHDMNSHVVPFYKDKFAHKILFVEAFVWSLACYSVSTAGEWTIHDEDVHLHVKSLFLQGIAVGLTVATLLFLFIRATLKGSSRGHRVIVESFIALGLGLPVGGISAIADINTGMDISTPVIVETNVNDIQKRVRPRFQRGFHVIFELAEIFSDNFKSGKE